LDEGKKGGRTARERGKRQNATNGTRKSMVLKKRLPVEKAKRNRNGSEEEMKKRIKRTRRSAAAHR
jgi:hypothetical protein